VGTPIAGRTRSELEGLIGFFVNTLALRMDTSGDPEFPELVRRVREVTLGAYQHQELPFEKLVEELHPQRSLSHNPLFQVMFVLQNVSPVAPVADDEPAEKPAEMAIETGTAKFDLLLAFAETSWGLQARLEYSTDLFEAVTVRRMAAHLGRLLAGIAENPSLPLSALPMLTAEDRGLLLEGWSGKSRSYPLHVCLHRWIEAQARHAPEAPAVRFAESRLSYGELEARAEALARRLRSLGVGPEVRVGLCAERSLELVVGLVAVLKAGGAYVPLDPSYPAERLAFMLSDARVAVLLTQERLLESLPPVAAPVLCLDREFDVLAPEDGWEDPGTVTSENPAYVIYTSGSTGRPKGVVIPHRAAANHMYWLQETFGLKSSDRVLQKTPFSFDVSVWEFLWPLMNGAELVMAVPGGHRDNEYVRDEIARRGITVVYFIASMLQLFLETPGLEESCRTLRHVFCGGEAMPSSLPERFHARLPRADLQNIYGPTETAIDSTWWTCEAGSTRRVVPIGRPVSNTQFYVLDRHLELVPPGAVGELYIGGSGLGRGYLERAELTAERFVPHPLAGDGGRLYRTGDLGRYLWDGALEFLGRVDEQVKVRGYRIEVGEIEAVLGRHPNVQEVVVVAREVAPGDRRLVAYVVTGAEPAELRAFVQERLPDYMVPSAFVLLEALPHSPSGKLDRNLLPAPIWRDEETAAGAAPRTPAEEGLARIWREVLSIGHVGAEDDFFHLGGHSLLATQMTARVREVFGVELPLRQVFETPRLADLAALLPAPGAGSTAAPARIPRRSRDHRPRLSFAQERLWFLHQMTPQSSVYNVPLALRLRTVFRLPALEQSLRELARRHEVLRTTFVMEGDRPVQQIAPEPAVTVGWLDLLGWPPALREEQAGRLAAEEAQRPFDLQTGPLLRAAVVRLGESDHLLLLTLHHIVSDGWSAGILLRELEALYEAAVLGRPSPLPELPVQYADFAEWQRDWLTGEVLENLLGYWRRQLAGAPPVLELPADRPRPAVQSFRGALEPVRLPADLVAGLHEIGRGEGATLFMTLLAAFQVLLGRSSGQTDLVIGSPIANRTRSEIEGLIGFFVNTLVLRTELALRSSFREHLGRVREVTLGAFAHQDLPFEMLVNELSPERNLSHNPLFQVMFVLQNAPTKPQEAAAADPGAETSAAPSSDTGTSKFDLLLSLSESARGVEGVLEYNTDLFDAATIRAMAAHFETLVAALPTHLDEPIATLPLLTAAEREQLDEWNRTAEDYPRGVCVHHLVERQADRTPDAAAVLFGVEQLSYAALEERANRLAHFLRDRGVGPESLVGLCVERSHEMVLAVLAVLKAGGAYVPLDPSYPQERLAFILEDVQARVIVTQRSLLAALPPHGAATVLLDDHAAAIAAASAERPAGGAIDRNLFYVLFTSGSTGRPKGCAVEHRSAVALLHWLRHWWQDEDLEGVLASTSLNFDPSLFELFAPLIRGGAVLVAENALSLPDLPLADRVTLISTVASALAELVRMDAVPPSVRVANLAGEPLQNAVVQRIYEGSGIARAYNLYGLTEDTLYTTGELIVRGSKEAITIGRPIANRQIHILSAELEPVPVGVAGQIYVGGAGLGRCYVHRPELTAERFLPNPFTAEPGERLYRTGDLARRRRDGRIEYLGRLDHQVKIRGFRVELGEIEAALIRIPDVRDAVVLARDEAGGKRLTAFLVPRPGASLTAGALRAALRDRLPEHMIPADFVVLAALPLTPNGKVDRLALTMSRAGGLGLEGDHTPPRTPVERRLAELWTELLRIEWPGIDQSLFELGGHSLLATQLVSRIRTVFQVELPLRQVFEEPTIAELALAVVQLQAEQDGGADLVTEIEELSDEETFRRLREEASRLPGFPALPPAGQDFGTGGTRASLP
jgi:amino acid adenylation domain-containing protein